MPSLSPASAPENATPSGPFVLCSARGNTTAPVSLCPGYSLTCSYCTFTYILNNECAIKHAGDTEVAYLRQGVKPSSPPSLLSGRNKLPMTMRASVCGARGLLRLLRSADVPDRRSLKDRPCLGPGERRVGARLTVAHKRISPAHKDSGQLPSLTRSTKEVTFVCLRGRRRCGRTGRAGGRKRRRWHWWWDYNDTRGG